jgi:hypothetical protein
MINQRRGVAVAQKTWYVLTVTTSNLRGAGNDAEVYAALEGSSCRSEREVLPSGPGTFSRGRQDTFRCNEGAAGCFS